MQMIFAEKFALYHVYNLYCATDSYCGQRPKLVTTASHAAFPTALQSTGALYLVVRQCVICYSI